MALKQFLSSSKLWVMQYLKYQFQKDIDTPDISKSITNEIVIYKGDINATQEFIVSAVARDSGTLIAARSGGKVVEIRDGNESEVLYVKGATDWRGLWKDSKGNIFISPHSTPILGSIKMEDRGIFKLSREADRFVKVLSLYNPHSAIKSETEENDDTIWTFC